MAPCSSSVAQCPWTTQLYSDWDCSTRPDALRRCPQGCFFHPRQTSTSKTSCLQSPPLVLSSNERRAQARWLNVHGQLSSILTGTAPLGLMYSAVVPKGAFSIRDQPQPPNPLVSTLGSNWRGAQARWFNANHQAEAFGQAPILSMVLHSNVSPGVHPHRDQPSCHKPRLDKMVSAGGPQWRGTHDQWLVKRLNPVPVAIGDFDGLFCGSALLGLKSLPRPPFLGVGPVGFWLPLAFFPVSKVFVAGLCSCLSSMFSPLP